MESLSDEPLIHKKLIAKDPLGLIIDAYAHVGMPRFVSVQDYLALMDGTGIAKAVLCSFDSSPDLDEIHSAIYRWPLRFRGIGVPLGNNRHEMEAGCRAQLAAGFIGLRLTDSDVLDRPWLMALVGEAKAVAIVCGKVSQPACARACLDALDRYENLTIIGGHFGGLADPKAFANSAISTLFSHPNFHVVFSRQGAMPEAEVVSWAQEVVARTGWGRVMWGSETPVLFWRNETLQQAITWIEKLRPSLDERAAFLGGNANQLLFEKLSVVLPLRMPFATFDRARPIATTLFSVGCPLQQEVAGRLVKAWLAAGGKGTLAAYTENLLDSVLPPVR